ncbi:MAG: hypothetical protein WCT36_01850 [Candidatus Gracilibacteria bacterium]|jgi:hypothetical protein
MDKFFVAIIGMPSAFVIIYYRRQIKDFIGDIPFAEKYLGIGGTHKFIIFLAVCIFIFSLMYAMGTWQSWSTAVLGPLFGK